MKRIFAGAAATLALLLCAPAQADVGGGFRVSTLGAGAEFAIGLSPQINVRIVANGFAMDKDFDKSGIDYDGKVRLQTVGGLIDWYPGRGAFRLTAGLLANGNRIDLESDCTPSCDIGGLAVSRDPADAGRLSSRIDYSSVAPYLGFGWAGGPQLSRWYVSFDAGVMFQGDTQASLRASGSYLDSTTLEPVTDEALGAAMSRERQSLRNEFDEYEFYPVVGFGFGYVF